MDAYEAGQLSRTFDRLHSISYFVPEVNEKLGALGLHGRAQYFATRAAPMGAVSAKVVAATFYNFNPDLIAEGIPAAWDVASPAEIIQVRYEIVDIAVLRALGEQLARSAEVARGASILRQAAETISDVAGRPLYAGHAELPWPDEPFAQLWHAITLLREFRGDGHIAALLTHGLSGVEALVSHTATGIGFDPEFGRVLRGWSPEQWAGAVDSLRLRGTLDVDGHITDAGMQLRSDIEDLTDQLAYQPWRTLPDDRVTELWTLATRVRDAVQAAQLTPAGAFGPRYGQHR